MTIIDISIKDQSAGYVIYNILPMDITNGLCWDIHNSDPPIVTDGYQFIMCS